ncbi:hypothetical protein CERSUDRAFT_103769 [Gelatoporia subvermispora B]|uniref:UspA domain-containing protein n=1 Tax=Ceriporiopsis subvermispora (strain B) TaxID=914234 RepID=M2QRW2_CERS8|nr:hypothetical protein CERSUDRAFT_103769 [Gelatoporia subvermispora B]
MADRGSNKPEALRKRAWRAKYGAVPKDKDSAGTPLVTTREGEASSYAHPLNAAGTSSAASSINSFKRSESSQSINSSPPSRPTTPLLLSKRWSSSTNLLTKEDPDSQNALERTTSLQQPSSRPSESSRSGSFSRMSLSSVMGGLSSLTLSRGGNDDKERGRSEKKEKGKSSARSSSFSGTIEDSRDSSRGRARSQSPFRLRRLRTRDSSPNVEALSQSDVESDAEVATIRPRNAFSLSAASDDESADESDEDSDSEEESWSDTDQFDPVTERNTERNALIPADVVEADAVDVPDPLGEGVNVVLPPEPYFPTTLNNSGRNPRRRKSTKPHDTLPLETSRPVFQRDRCTITITHGYPTRILEETGRRNKRYVLASDLSDESRYALEWGIGTVLRDGDEMIIVSVIENESKVDPMIPNPADRAAKLRAQQERQALAYILVRQATSLLQRTRLNVTISCQAWHAKNSRHMLLDIVDFIEPTMLIVGSRGLGKLKGILLGSTSHYLIQKCSVPVMVARRRLKRPPRRSAHLAPHRARVSLAQAAGVDRVAPKVDRDVATMRDELKEEEERPPPSSVEEDEDPETEVEGESSLGRKVAGE